MNIFSKSPFIKDFFENYKRILLTYLTIFILLTCILDFLLKKDLAMSMVHSFYVGGLVSL